jgi:serine/threonine-protein kinase
VEAALAARGTLTETVTTPDPRFLCPRCRAAYTEPLRFCQQCGANMQRVSALEMAALRDGVSSEDLAKVASGSAQDAAAWATATDRRVTASAQTWLGRVVDGRYRVIEVVGRGGMGVVYKVEHTRMGKIAAMKVLHKDLAEDPEVVRRFEREASAVSRLNHPNTVQVFDFGASQDALYLIMEYVRGQDLAHVIDRDGPLPFARAAPLFGQICGALAEAHELGIVHRDLKPENVLITRTTGGRDFAKVLDFGLAKIGARETSLSQTDKTEIVGTPYFMSPEQIRGDDVDARADVYSLGALMYTVLCGKPPFTAKSAVGVLTKHLTAEVQPPSAASPDAGITAEIDDIVVRALAKEPGERWQNVGGMASAIERVYADQVGDRTPIHAPRPTGRKLTEDEDALSGMHLRREDLDDYEAALKRRSWVVWGFVLVMVLGGVAAAGWWLFLRPTRTYTHEVEPNNDEANATRIAPGTAVTGYLGKRLSRGEPDRDVYSIEWPSGSSHVVSVRVSGLPNLDMMIQLHGSREHQIASADETGVGGGEALMRWRVDGALHVHVTEALVNGALPVENVSDVYTLTVTEETEAEGWEVEPNGNAVDAIALPPGSAVRGWLEARGEVDLLRWDGDSGKVLVEVAAPPALPLVWRGPDGAVRPPGAATLVLEKGATLRLERSDRGVPHDRPLPGIDAAWSVTATPVK